MRLVMMGTGRFALPTFESLLESAHEVAALVTQPPHAAARRRQAPTSPLSQIAERRGLAIYRPEHVNAESFRRTLAQLQPDLLVVCDYGQILSAATLSAAPLGGVNLHASLLPKYRGAAPINWAIYHGERETGVSVIHMTPQIDAGPLLISRRAVIDPEQTAEELETRLADLGVAAVRESLEMLQRWDGTTPLGQPQDAAQSCRAPRLKKEDGRVDWFRTASQIQDQVRAMKPWPGTFTFWHDPPRAPLRLILDRVTSAADSPMAVPGEVLPSEGQHIAVAAGQGVVRLHRIQPAGKKTMDAAEFLRGHALRPGHRLGPEQP